MYDVPDSNWVRDLFSHHVSLSYVTFLPTFDSVEKTENIVKRQREQYNMQQRLQMRIIAVLLQLCGRIFTSKVIYCQWRTYSIHPNNIWKMVTKDNTTVLRPWKVTYCSVKVFTWQRPQLSSDYCPKNRNKTVFHTVPVTAQRKCGMIILHYRECVSSTVLFCFFLLARGLGGQCVKRVGVCVLNVCIIVPFRSVTSGLGRLCWYCCMSVFVAN